MENKYDRAIEHIEVTAEMHDRIIKNLGGIDSVKKQSKAPSLVVYRKYISIAACFVLLLVGTFVIYNSLTQTPPIQVVPNIEEYSSVGGLSNAVGFKVREVKTYPFDVEQTRYAAF